MLVYGGVYAYSTKRRRALRQHKHAYVRMHVEVATKVKLTVKKFF